MIRAEQQRTGRRRGREPPEASAAGDPIQPPSRPGDRDDRVLGKARSAAGDEVPQPAEGRVAQLFAEKVPDGCPSDPLEKNAYLQALALLDLCEGHGQRSGRPEVIVVVDTRDSDGTRAARRLGIPVELPVRVFTDLVARADLHTVVVRDGAIVHAPGRLDLGRTTRLANAAQRRALRAIYPRCAIPDCPTRFDHCKIHHVRWWRHGGRTDLENLVPVCVRHHTAIHHEGWTIGSRPIGCSPLTLPNGEVMTTGPPRRRAA